MKRIVILDPISTDAGRRLEEETGWKVEERLNLTPEELLQNVDDADVLIVRSATKVTADVIAAAKRLKVIGRAGIGVDNIDMEAASERDIRVINTPGATTTSVSELHAGRDAQPGALAARRRRTRARRRVGAREVPGLRAQG